MPILLHPFLPEGQNIGFLGNFNDERF